MVNTHCPKCHRTEVRRSGEVFRCPQCGTGIVARKAVPDPWYVQLAMVGVLAIGLTAFVLAVITLVHAVGAAALFLLSR